MIENEQHAAEAADSNRTAAWGHAHAWPTTPSVIPACALCPTARPLGQRDERGVGQPALTAT
eukprot:9291257-Pyramimonas_sp.AAC.1